MFADASVITTGLQAQIDNCDVVMPVSSRLRTSAALTTWYQNTTTANGSELGVYMCSGNGRHRSPTAYFRRLPWEARQFGGGSAGVWANGTKLSNTWDDFRAQENYEMPFLTDNSATPGKIMMAWRDGVYDYEYFGILDDMIAQAITAGVPSSLTDPAQILAGTLAANAIAEIPDAGGWSGSWKTAAFNDTFDRARIQVLDMIDALDAAINGAPATCAELIGSGGGMDADLNDDCQINAADLTLMAAQWLGNGTADIIVDGAVNLLDFAVVASEWMTCYDPVSVNCP